MLPMLLLAFLLYVRAWQPRVLHHNYEVYAVAYSPDGRQLATTSRKLASFISEGVTKIWDAETGQPMASYASDEDATRNLAFAPDGKTIAMGSKNEVAATDLRDTATGKIQHTLPRHDFFAYDVAFSPDGKLLAQAEDSGTLSLFDVKSGTRKRFLKKIMIEAGGTVHFVSFSTVYSVSFSPDGKILAAGCADATVQLWDVGTGRLVRTLTGHPKSVTSVEFSPDGRLIASSSNERVWSSSMSSASAQRIKKNASDNAVRLRDARTGKVLHVLRGHTAGIDWVAFSPDGKTVASGSDDKTVRLWDTSSGRLQQILEGHSGTVDTIDFSPDGARLASGSNDRTVRLWRLR